MHSVYVTVAAEAQVGLHLIQNLVWNAEVHVFNLVTDAWEMALSFVNNVSAAVPWMMKLVSAAMVTENGNVEDAAGLVWNIVHCAVVKDLNSGNTLAENVDKQE